MQTKLLSLNCENMADLVPEDPTTSVSDTDRQRSELLAAIIREVNPDIVGMVEAPTTAERTQRWIDTTRAGTTRSTRASVAGCSGLLSPYGVGSASR